MNIASLCLAIGVLTSSFLQSSGDSPLRHPDSAEMNAKAPEAFRIRLATTKGDIVLEMHRDWAPLGVDRFYNLVRHGYYDEVRFHRVTDGQWAQFGINGDPDIAKLWREQTFPDEPRRAENVQGTIAFAFAVPNGRTTQVFINLRDNRETHDVEPFVPLGRIVEGMNIALALNPEYGETAGSGIRSGLQGPVFEGGNAYLEKNFPRLDYIERATVEPEP